METSINQGDRCFWWLVERDRPTWRGCKLERGSLTQRKWELFVLCWSIAFMERVIRLSTFHFLNAVWTYWRVSKSHAPTWCCCFSFSEKKKRLKIQLDPVLLVTPLISRKQQILRNMSLNDNCLTCDTSYCWLCMKLITFHINL